MRALAASVLLLAAVGCAPRTFIRPAEPQAPKDVYVPRDECDVRDYPSGADLPEGAKNLGWITVSQQDSDEATEVALHKEICKRGGNASSQMAWVKGPSDAQPRLTANAWVLP